MKRRLTLSAMASALMLTTGLRRPNLPSLQAQLSEMSAHDAREIQATGMKVE